MADGYVLFNRVVGEGTAPVPARFGTDTYLFFRGEQDADLEYVQRTAAGWDNWQNLRFKLRGVGVRAGVDPAAIEYKGRLYVFWHGSGKDGFFYSSTADGADWSAVTGLSAQIGGVLGIGGAHAPVLAVYDDRLFVFWRGLGKGEGFFHASFDGQRWSYHDSLQRLVGSHGVQPDTMPAVAVAGGKLFVFWNGAGRDGIFYATLAAGRWSDAVPLRDAIGAHGILDGTSPQASTLDDSLLLTWRGSGGDGLWFTQWHGGGFDGQRSMRALAYGTGDGPVRAIPVPPAAGKLPFELYWAATDDNEPRRIHFRQPRERRTWMKALDPKTSIGAIDLPGTHDSAAIDRDFFPATYRGGINAHPYVCQNQSLREQADNGIRVFDLRVQLIGTVEARTENLHAVDIHTCHGNLHLGSNANRFQSLASALDELAGFVRDQPSEALVIVLKIDDERFLDYDRRAPAYLRTRPLDLSGEDAERKGRRERLRAQLYRRLGQLIEDRRASFYNADRTRVLPTLGDLRGKILLLRRIDCDHSLPLGDHINWSDHGRHSYPDWRRGGPGAANTAPVTMAIQDRFENIGNVQKEAAFAAAASDFPGIDVLFNYASYVGPVGVEKHLIQYPMMKHISAATLRYRTGWAMFDFAGFLTRSGPSGEAVDAVDYVLGTY